MAGWCGGTFTSGATCPDGSAPTSSPNGEAAAATTAPGSGQVTGTYAWNQDTTPVQVGGGRSYNGRDLQETPNMTTVADGQEYFNKIYGAGTAPGASQEDKDALSSLLNGLRQYTNSKIGTRGAADEAWHQVLTDASRAGVDALALLNGETPSVFAEQNAAENGPHTTTTYQQPDPASLRDLADKVGLVMLGRGVNDNEWSRIESQVAAAQKANPQVYTTTPNGVDSVVTGNSGLTDAGRQDIVENILAKNPQYGDYQKATTLMSWLDKAISERPRV